MEKKKEKWFSNLQKNVKQFFKKKDTEYSKRLLTKIINHSLLMMWGTYILAWYDKIDIAETLSKTIATSIIAVVVGYLAKSVIENISKNTTAFGNNVSPIVTPSEINNDDTNNNEIINYNRDC